MTPVATRILKKFKCILVKSHRLFERS